MSCKPGDVLQIGDVQAEIPADVAGGVKLGVEAPKFFGVYLLRHVVRPPGDEPRTAVLRWGQGLRITGGILVKLMRLEAPTTEIVLTLHAPRFRAIEHLASVPYQ